MDELQHHGIKGQKWGVRRFQNADGSLTTAGKQRASATKKRTDAKNRGTLTNAQLKQKIERLQLEKQLRELTNAEVNSGRVYAQKILKDVGSKVLTTAATNIGTAASGALLYAGKAAITKLFGPQEFVNAIFNGGPKKK